MKDRMPKTGIVGAVVMALCCFTPLLVALPGALGISAALGWIGAVLLPAPAVVAGVTIHAIARRRRRA